MKKKLVTSALAIASAAVLTLSFAGCKKEETISKEDFVNGIYSSYATYTENYEKAHDDPASFGGMSISANSTRKYSQEYDWTYTPVGSSAEATDTYTESSTTTLSLKVDVKAIDGVIHLFVEAVEKEAGTEYVETADGSNGPKAAKKYANETTTTWEFGKSEETFYVRTAESEKVGESLTGEPSLGAPTTTKEYSTYSSESSYYSSLTSILSQYSNEYVVSAYSISSMDYYYDYVEYFKSGDTYKAAFSAISFTPSGYGSSGKMKGTGNASYGPQGVTFVESSTTRTSPSYSTETSYSYHIDYSSDAQAISDPFSGYTESYYSLGTSGAYFDLPSSY